MSLTDEGSLLSIPLLVAALLAEKMDSHVSEKSIIMTQETLVIWQKLRSLAGARPNIRYFWPSERTKSTFVLALPFALKIFCRHVSLKLTCV